MWCASHVDDEDTIRPIHSSLSKFNEDVADINIKRLEIYFNEESIIDHILTDHIRAPLDNFESETFLSLCTMVVPCRICFAAYVRDSDKHPIHNVFVCSLSCYFDHEIQVPIHHDDPLVSLIINLRTQFATNHKILGLVDKFFNIVCPICGHAASDQTGLLSHFKACVSQVMSLSLRYGIPYDYDGFFSTPLMRMKERQARQETAYIQMAHFVEAIKTTYSRTPATSSTQPHLMGKVRSLEEVEAQFASSSTSTYGHHDQQPAHYSKRSTDPTDQQTAQNFQFFEDDIDFANACDQTPSYSETHVSPAFSSPDACLSPTRPAADNIDSDSDNSVICLDDLPAPRPLPTINDSRIVELMSNAESIVKQELDSPVSSPPKKKTKSRSTEQE